MSKEYVKTIASLEDAIKIDFAGVTREIKPATWINSYCGNSPFYLNGEYVPEGFKNVPGGQIQVSWEEESGETTDTLVIFIFDENDEGDGSEIDVIHL